MTKRTNRTTLSLPPEAVATLRLLADRLGFGGNVSEFLRWLAETADGAFDETVTLLETAGAIAAGGDDWTVLAVVERLLPALRLTVDWERVDTPPRPIAPPEIALDADGVPVFRLHDAAEEE